MDGFKDSATKIPFLQGARKESLPGLCSFVWVSWVGLLGKALTFNAFFLNSRHEKYGFVAEHFLIFPYPHIGFPVHCFFDVDNLYLRQRTSWTRSGWIPNSWWKTTSKHQKLNTWSPALWALQVEMRLRRPQPVSCCQWNQKASHGHTRKCPIPIFPDRFPSSLCSCGMEITAKSSRVTPLNQLQSLMKLPFCTVKVLKVVAEWQ